MAYSFSLEEAPSRNFASSNTKVDIHNLR